MTAEQLAAFRGAVLAYAALTEASPATAQRRALAYLVAIRRVKAAFGVATDREGWMPTRAEEARWARLQAAVIRCGEREREVGRGTQND